MKVVTLDSWVKFDSTSGNHPIMTDDDWVRGGLHYQIYSSQYGFDVDGNSDRTFTWQPTAGEWKFLSVSYDVGPNNIKLSLNGAFKESIPNAAVPISFNNPRISGWLAVSNQAARSLEGCIASFHVWSIATDGSDMCSGVGLAAAYELDGLVGTTAADTGPSGLDGEWSGTEADDSAVCNADGTCQTDCDGASGGGVNVELCFGTEIPDSAGDGAWLDDGTGYTADKGYGWDCEGDLDVDYSGGRRGMGRDVSTQDDDAAVVHIENLNEFGPIEGGATDEVKLRLASEPMYPGTVYLQSEAFFTPGETPVCGGDGDEFTCTFQPHDEQVIFQDQLQSEACSTMDSSVRTFTCPLVRDQPKHYCGAAQNLDYSGTYNYQGCFEDADGICGLVDVPVGTRVPSPLTHQIPATMHCADLDGDGEVGVGDLLQVRS